MMFLTKRKARAVAPDISAYRGVNGLEAVRMRACEYTELLRHGGIDPDSPFPRSARACFNETLILEGYRATADGEKLEEALRSWTSASLNAGCPVMFELLRRDGQVVCRYSAPNVNLLAKSIPDAECRLGHSVTVELARSAIVLGVPSMRLDYDALIESAGNRSFVVAVLCLPSARIGDQIDRISAIRGMFEANREAFVPGNGDKVRVEVPEVKTLVDLCDSIHRNLLERPGRSRLVFSCAAEDDELLDTVIALISGCCPPTDRNPFKTAVSRNWDGGDGCYPLTQSGGPAAYDVALEDAVLALMPPAESHAGFTVKLSSAANNRRAFPGIGGLVEEPYFEIGNCTNDGSVVWAPMSSMHSAFICGNPGTGKSQMLFNMAKTANDEGVPTLFIEASTKKEGAYHLFGCTRNMEVLGVGPAKGNLPLRFNPLAVTPGIQVAKHALDFAEALLLAADDDPEPPLPQAVEGMVKRAYESAGWRLGEIAYEDPARPWPTMAELDPEAYVRAGAYEAKVKGNLIQAIRTRLDRLMTYGDMFCSTRRFGLDRLIGGNADLELGDMGERLSAFAVSCILGTLIEYAMQLPTLPHGGKPRLVVFIDELNALLACDGANGTIANLLSRAYREFRSKGIMFVAAAQRVEGAEGIIANAALKVAFRCDWRGDAEVIAGSFGLEPYQQKLVGMLPDMEAIAKLPGIGAGAVPVRTELFGEARATGLKAACCVCRARILCDRCKEIARRALAIVPEEKVRAMAAAVDSPIYDPVAIRNARDGLVGYTSLLASEEKNCLVGLAMERAGVGFEIARRAFA